LEETAKQFSISEDAAAEELKQATRKLLEARGQRIRPHLDDKILTSWNGLMISALAKASQALEEPAYAAAAERAAQFILSRMYDSTSGLLLRRYRDREAAIPGFLDDYAFLTASFLDLYETGFDPRYLELALALTAKMRELFEDPVDGAFFTSGAGDQSLVMRMKDDYDGAEPSGNSIAALNLARLAHITGRADLRDAADGTLRALWPKMLAQPAGVPQMLVAADYIQAAGREVVIAGDPANESTRAFLRELHTRFLPYTAILVVHSADSRARMEQIFPAIGEMREIDGKPTAYVCQDYVCKLPTTDLSQFGQLLQ
jgi:uncharacterized protein YyaL (SSP411 family)